MERRAFLGTVGAASVAGLAGCLGDDDEETDALREEITELEETIADKDAEIKSLEERETALEAEIETLETEIETLEDEIEALEADGSVTGDERAELVEQRLMVLYELAARYYDLAEADFETATDFADDEEWTPAARWFGIAYRSYDAVVGITYEVGELAAAEGYTEADELAENSNVHAERMRNACDHYGLSVEYFAAGRNDAGSTELENGDITVNGANQYEFVSVEEFTATL